MVADHSINVTTLWFTYPLFPMEVKKERYIKRGAYTILYYGKHNRGFKMKTQEQNENGLFVTDQEELSKISWKELRFAIDNGRTLCIDCHKKTDTYGRKVSQ